MTRRIAALAFALLAAVGCDSGGGDAAPEEGSCQALVDEMLAGEECRFALGNSNISTEGDPEESAACAAEAYDLPSPPETMIEGEAYSVAYTALCEIHGNTAAGFCDVADALGCEG